MAPKQKRKARAPETEAPRASKRVKAVSESVEEPEQKAPTTSKSAKVSSDDQARPDEVQDDTTTQPDTSSKQTTGSNDKFTSFEMPSGSKPIPCIRSHPAEAAPISLVFTHGAGGGLSAPALMNFARGFASTGSPVVCFQGNMNLKARTRSFATVLDHEKKQRKAEMTVAYGGRSMGARAAVLAAQSDESIKTLVLVSYPLIGPGGAVRDRILLDIKSDVDVLFVSGDGDSMCDFPRLATLRKKMKAKSWMVVVEGADHGMTLKGGKKWKDATEEVAKETGRIAARWVEARDEEHKDMTLRWNGDKPAGSWVDADAQGHQEREKGGIEKYFGKKEGEEEHTEAVSGTKKKQKKGTAGKAD
ncbi:Alpha/Beta hydrolase protein [Exophiala viscosa]|uniref:Alpha/Beta hydrolase protein n=1 Tax=Exophiala viscosa TaxID=2486360 RepID=UPI002196F655|nr:Alpha/Beta hydrolase protein [Exophiala viscosa]